jgi:hypothetical protein
MTIERVLDRHRLVCPADRSVSVLCELTLDIDLDAP